MTPKPLCFVFIAKTGNHFRHFPKFATDVDPDQAVLIRVAWSGSTFKVVKENRWSKGL